MISQLQFNNPVEGNDGKFDAEWQRWLSDLYNQQLTDWQPVSGGSILVPAWGIDEYHYRRLGQKMILFKLGFHFEGTGSFNSVPFTLPTGLAEYSTLTRSVFQAFTEMTGDAGPRPATSFTVTPTQGIMFKPDLGNWPVNHFQANVSGFYFEP